MADECDALEDKFPLRPAQGVAIGLVIGTSIWIIIDVTLGLGPLNPSVLLIASLVLLVVVAVPALRGIRRLHGPCQTENQQQQSDR